MSILRALVDLFSWLPPWFVSAVGAAFFALLIIGLIRFIRWIVETIPGF